MEATRTLAQADLTLVMAKFAASAVLITCALVVSACGSSDIGSEDSVVTTQAASSTLAETTTTEASQSTEPTPTTSVTTTAISAGEFEAFDIPPGFFLESFVMSERLVIFGRNGSGPGGIFWAVDQPIESAQNIQDLAPVDLDPGSINQMVYFEGRYYGFPIWAEPEDDLHPTMYVSDDGVAWTKTKFESVTRQAALRLTPDEPASLGGSGVSDVVVADGQIVATGWVTEDDVTSPVIWSGDGTNWDQTFLPVVERATQGGAVATSQLGQIVTLEGGSHYGFGTYFRTAESDWTVVPPSIDEDGTERFTRQLGATDSHFYRLEFSHLSNPLISLSPDGTNWEELALPDVEFEVLSMHVSADDRVSVYDPRWILEGDANPIVWTANDGDWVPISYEGTRIISVDDNTVITASDDQIFVYELSS